MNKIKVITHETDWEFEKLVNKELKTLYINSDVSRVSVDYHTSSVYSGMRVITTYVAIITYFDLSEG